MRTTMKNIDNYFDLAELIKMLAHTILNQFDKHLILLKKKK